MKVPASGKVIGKEEKDNLLRAIEDFVEPHNGHWISDFEYKLHEFIGTRFAIACNSGSSANLLALSALTGIELGEMAIMPGDEVITAALCFPTTVNPIVQIGAVPVFVDIDPDTLNIDVSLLSAALTGKTKAVMLAHTLGRPFDVEFVADFCTRNGLWLVEDCCDALGSEYNGQKCGDFGDISTYSFFPAHNITTGEGGAVCASSPILNKLTRSFRDWGRDCWCEPGFDNTCGRRLAGEYDHKYIYSHIGYNLKTTDLQACIGVAQMDKLPEFNQIRRENYQTLLDGLFGLPIKTLTLDEGMIPFGFPIICDDNNSLIQYLELHGIGTRRMFAGNITKQPAYKNVEHRISRDLKHTDYAYRHAFWIGCWHGLNYSHMEYIIKTMHEYYA